MDIVEKFKTYLKDDFFYIIENQKDLKLTENKGKPYEVVLKVNRLYSKFLVVHNLEVLKKEHASYLKQHPKDCDYILLDLIEHVVYVVELKDTDTTSGEFLKQLRSGEYWLQHLLFCCQVEQYVENWSVKRIGIRYTPSRPSRVRRPKRAEQNDNRPSPLKYMKDVGGYDLFLAQGREFHLDSIIPV